MSYNVTVIDNPNYMNPIGSHTQNSSLSTKVTLTKPAEARRILMQAQTQNIRFTLDGTDPTTTKGFQLAAGDYILLPVPGTAIEVIEETTTAVLDYQWMR